MGPLSHLYLQYQKKTDSLQENGGFWIEQMFFAPLDAVDSYGKVFSSLFEHYACSSMLQGTVVIADQNSRVRNIP